METINWKIDGMSCSTCALTISKYLEKKGLQNVKVSLASGDVSFDSSGQPDRGQLQKGIEDLGYTVVAEDIPGAPAKKQPLNKHLRYFLFCLPFTAVLLLPMPLMGIVPALMLPWVQFAL